MTALTHLSWLGLTLIAAFGARAAAAAPLQEQAEMPLWPGAAPGSEHVSVIETAEDRSTDPKKPDRAVHGIRTPTLTAFLPKQANGASLIIAPGGGYVREVIDKEGSEIATWFAQRGVTVFVLKYRLPGEGHEHPSFVALQDAQRAVRLVRAQAASWQLDPARVGFLGFSAGGHVAASLATQFARKVLPEFVSSLAVGDSYYQNHLFQEAARQYRRVAETHGRSPLAEEARYKEGCRGGDRARSLRQIWPSPN